MRVLQILHTDERGGVLTLASMIEDGLAAHGFQVDTDYLFSRLGLGTLAKARAAAALAKRLTRCDHDAIIAYQATACILTGLAGRIAGCPRRIAHQTALPGETALPVRLADRLVGTFGGYTANIANTQFTLDMFRSYPAGYRRRMILIEHGLDAPRAARARDRDRDETRARLGLPANEPILLNVGRMTSQKNQSVLLDAMAGIENAMLVVAGHGPDEADLRSRAEALGLSSRIRLLGAVDGATVADLYGASDLFVFPSTWETFGLAAVEAAMAGLPVVASDLAVLREVLSSPPSPVSFVAPHDAEGWRDAVQAKLAAPPTLSDRLAFSEALSRRYAKARMIDSYVTLLRQSPAGAA